MVTVLLVAAALCCWPAPAWRERGSRPWKRAADTGAGGALPGAPALRSVATGVAVSVVGAGIVVAGAAGAVAATLTCWTARVLTRQQLSRRRRRRGRTDILAAVRAMARELRAGAEPAVAAENSRAVARGDGATVLHELLLVMRAHQVSLAGITDRARPTDAAGTPGGRSEPAAESLRRLEAGWLLSSRYGVAFSPLIDGLVAELADALAGDARRAGEVAGPRMSGYVMAGLPVMGLLLGAGMGADPVGVLLGTTVGRVLLVAGVLLSSVGLLWSARIVAS